MHGMEPINQLVIGLGDFTSESDSKRAREKKEKNDPPPFLLQESELLLACERTGQESRWHASNG